METCSEFRLLKWGLFSSWFKLFDFFNLIIVSFWLLITINQRFSILFLRGPASLLFYLVRPLLIYFQIIFILWLFAVWKIIVFEQIIIYFEFLFLIELIFWIWILKILCRIGLIDEILPSFLDWTAWQLNFFLRVYYAIIKSISNAPMIYCAWVKAI